MEKVENIVNESKKSSESRKRKKKTEKDQDGLDLDVEDDQGVLETPMSKLVS